MNIHRKIEILADAAKYDASCASSGSRRENFGQGLGNTDGVGICHSYTPDGRCVSLLKILLTNWCIYDCRFCVNRITSDTPRARFTADEIVWLTIEFYKRNYIEGLFLSSGIIQSPDYTMEQLTSVARRLRLDEKYFGYIHLKAAPGASAELLEEAGRYADRLSANVELPTDADLKKFAPEKSMQTVELTMSTLRDRRNEDVADVKRRKKQPRTRPTQVGQRRFMPAGQSTQMVIGATPSSDAAILRRADKLYHNQKLRRVYYSAYSPIPSPDGGLPDTTPPLMREHRLYQADWLLRFYGFHVEELTATQDDNLAIDIDPKLAWALRHREFFPVDVNHASREALLRVPGIGVRNVQRILKIRKSRKVTMHDLKVLRVALNRAAAFIVAASANSKVRLLDSDQLECKMRPNRDQPTHDTLPLFERIDSVITGEL